MAPKKKDAKKKDAKGPEDDQGMLQANQFVKKGFPTACADRGIEPLNLQIDRGEEGTSAFLRIAVHPGLCLDGKSPACTSLHVRALMEALMPYAYLLRLAFWSVPVRDDGAQAIGAFLAANRSLLTLELTDAGLGVPACKFLGEALERNSTLQTLRLDHNSGIGPAGVELLGDSLRMNLGLSNLSLTFCGLDGEPASAAITSRLLKAPAIKVLELKGNRFGLGGVLHLLEGLRACASLFRIDLSDTGFGSEPEVHAALEECFEANTVCHEYALHGNPVGDSAVYRWLGMVRKLPHLICLDVTNQCDPMLFKQMGDACTSNKKDWLKRQKKGKGKGKGGKKKK